MLRRTALTAALAGVALAAAAAPAAQADSIAYIKDGNVWLASPDGARQQQVTTTGGYYDVSQADDGTMITLIGGEKLRRISQTGVVLNEMATFVSDGAPVVGPANQFKGPFDPEISPDGTKVAFEWANTTYSSGAGGNCPPATCYQYRSTAGVGITHADRFTDTEEFGLLTGWISPQWINNDTIMRTFANYPLNEDMVFNKIGPGLRDTQMVRWFYDDQAQWLVESRVSRDLRKVAGIGGDADQKLRFYRVLEDPLAKDNGSVERCGELEAAAGDRFSSPSWSPDTTGIAYAQGNGIHVAAIPDLSGGCQPFAPGGLVLPGGSEPSWGPANIPPASAYQQTGPKVDPKVEVQKKTLKIQGAKLRAALKQGLVVKVAGATPQARVALTAKKGRSTVAKGSAKARANGSATVRLTFTKKAKRQLRAARKVTLKVSGGGVTGKVTLKR
ncbi:MAG: hypothetical protein JHC95_14830 [Solirubrobacteraceae bacterium]|nr:hypothetical protein [Solirubrobacteraceae bacterium]